MQTKIKKEMIEMSILDPFYNKKLKFLVKRSELKPRVVAIYIGKTMSMSGENEHSQSDLIERLERCEVKYSLPQNKGTLHVYISKKDYQKFNTMVLKESKRTRSVSIC
jgi:hypothetical protein